MLVEIMRGKLVQVHRDEVITYPDLRDYFRAPFITVDVPQPGAGAVAGFLAEDPYSVPFYIDSFELEGFGVVRGPFMIIGMGEDGETRQLTEEEISSYYLEPRDGQVPILRMRDRG